MKLPHLKMSKPLLVTAAVAGGVLVGGFTVSQSEAALDWLGFEQKLQQHEEQLDNHEARITNTEEDVADVQEATGTPPASNRQSVPAVTTPDPESAPEASSALVAVTIVAYEQLPLSEGNVNCKWTYSDGTSRTIQWKTRYTDSQGHEVNGTQDSCDDSVIGRKK